MDFVRKHRSELFLLLLVTVGLLGLGTIAPGLVGREAGTVESVCRQALAGTTAGRQALVSSCWWAPLPFLAVLLPALLLRTGNQPWAAMLTSALVAGLTAVWLWRTIRPRVAGGGTALLLLLALAMHPAIVSIGVSGGIAAVPLFAAVVVLISLAAWTGPGSLRHLVTGAFAYALLTLCGAELWGWMDAVALWVLLVTLARRDRRSRWHALWLLAFLPCVYALGVWVLMNWLIMGDPAYFLQSLRHGMVTGWHATWPDFSWSTWGAIGFCALAAGVGSVRRRGEMLAFGMLGLAAAGWAWSLTSLGLAWADVPAHALVLTAGVLACACLVSALGEASRTAAVGLAALPLLLLGGELLMGDVPIGTSVGTIHARLEALAGEPSSDEAVVDVLGAVESHVMARTPFAKVFVCGYDGVGLLGVQTNALFAASMDFHLDQVRQAYWGQQLYVLMHRPVGRSGADSVHWRDRAFFELGARHTLHAGTWGDWRLMEVVTAPTERQMRRWMDDLDDGMEKDGLK